MLIVLLSFVALMVWVNTASPSNDLATEAHAHRPASLTESAVLASSAEREALRDDISAPKPSETAGLDAPATPLLAATASPVPNGLAAQPDEAAIPQAGAGLPIPGGLTIRQDDRAAILRW